MRHTILSHDAWVKVKIRGPTTKGIGWGLQQTTTMNKNLALSEYGGDGEAGNWQSRIKDAKSYDAVVDRSGRQQVVNIF
jgi:hypothetical protein